MGKALTDSEMHSLAQAVARGRTSASWARRHDADVAVARECCLLPEFKRLVEARRVGVADRMVGKLMTRSMASIDQLYAAAIRSPGWHVKLSACRTLVDRWLVISRRFDDWRQLAELKSQLTALEEREAPVHSRR